MNGLKVRNWVRTAVLMTLTGMLAIGIAAGAVHVHAQTPPWEQAVTGLAVAPGDSAGSLAISWGTHPA